MRKSVIASLFFISVILISGCGYSVRSLAFSRNTRICIKPFENKVDLNISNEYSDENPYRLYRHGMETRITDAVIDRFLLDGYLKVISKEEGADLLLKGELVNYEKQPLRYDETTGDVEEYRANIVVNMILTDLRENRILWNERSFVGYSEFSLVGPRAESEDTAINNAIEDLARRIVERTVEDW